MKIIVLIGVVSLFALGIVSCGGSLSPSKSESEAAPAIQKFPADVESAAESALGSEAEVLIYGDLAKNGQTQLLAINRLKVTPDRTVPGILVARATILERDGGTWKEVFHCDEHLKNTRGYLGGTTVASVSSWRLQFEHDPQTGLQMYFTPLAQSQVEHAQTIAVRWNPKAKRYQSLDREYKEFLSELPQLEIPQSHIRQ